MITNVPIHLYALLAAAIAVMTMGSKLSVPANAWRSWIPTVPVFLASGHITISTLRQILDSPSGDLFFHAMILILLGVVSHRVYFDRLSLNETEAQSSISLDSGRYSSAP